MAQAESITTAIRQLMSREQPPKSTSPARQAHTSLTVALVGNVPHTIYAVANADDLNARAYDLEKVCGALHPYLAVAMGGTAQNMPAGGADHRYLDNLFQDLSTDAVGVIRTTPEEMRKDQNGRVP